MRRLAGTLLVVAGVLLLVGSLAGSAALAPDRSMAAPDERRTLVGIQGGGPGLHEHGRVALFDGRGAVVWEIDAADSYFDVTMLADGRVLAAFMSDGYEACGEYEPPCSRTGFQLIDPTPSPRVIHEYSFPVRTKQNSEVHDVESLGDGRFLLTDMEHERVLAVDRNGSVAWQWNASRRYVSPEDPTRQDWLHINDVDDLGDGRLLVSVRNAHELLVVERGNGVIDAVDGGGGDRFARQHNPQWLDDDAVLVADSKQDRVVELHRDGAGRWSVAWSIDGAGGLPFDWPRDADRLPNGNTLVTDTVNQRVVEVNESGEVVWSISTQNRPYEADRLPTGETVGGPRYGSGSGTAGETAPSADIPGLTAAYGLVRAGLPLPYWVSEWHLLAVLISFSLAGAGLWLRSTADDG